MPNLTISIDESIVRGARIKAIQEGTSVSAKVRDFLRLYVEGTDTQATLPQQSATARLMQSIADAAQASAPGTSVGGAGSLRSALYADDFRRLAREALVSDPATPAV